MVSYLDLPDMPEQYVRELLEWHDRIKIPFDIYDFWYFSRIKRPLPWLWNKEFMETMPHIYEFITQTLGPYINIERIALLETVKAVPDHTDSSAYEFNTTMEHEPVSVRIMLRNSDKDNFWLCPYTEEYWGKPAITYEGDGPNDFPKSIWKPRLGAWWALNNWVCYHGSNYHDGDMKTIMTIHGGPTDKYLELLQRSENMDGIYHPYVDKYFPQNG